MEQELTSNLNELKNYFLNIIKNQKPEEYSKIKGISQDNETTK